MVPPPLGVIKINFDGSVFTVAAAAAGSILRDRQGWLLQTAGIKLSQNIVPFAELIGLDFDRHSSCSASIQSSTVLDWGAFQRHATIEEIVGLIQSFSHPSRWNHAAVTVEGNFNSNAGDSVASALQTIPSAIWSRISAGVAFLLGSAPSHVPQKQKKGWG